MSVVSRHVQKEPHTVPATRRLMRRKSYAAFCLWWRDSWPWGPPSASIRSKPRLRGACVSAGARFINDVSCGRSKDLLEVAAAAGVELVLMHNRGRGEVSDENTRYSDLVEDVVEDLQHAAAAAVDVGVNRARIWFDPGIGFAKDAAQSLALIAGTERLVATGQRVLVGASRKSFIARLAPNADGSFPGPDERIGGTAASLTIAVLKGAHAVRVHDLAIMRQAVRIAEAARSPGAL